MIKTTINWTIKNLKSMYEEKHTLDFFYSIQHQSEQWNREK